MHIFIDESGTFAIPHDGRFSPCIVGAIIVPDFKLDQLFRKYERIRQNLPQENGEVKGRLLSEDQVAQVTDLLRRNNCIFEALVIEMSFEKSEEIETHRKGAASGLTAHLTDKHQPTLIQSVWEHRAELEEMSSPLYVQYTLMSELLANIIREIPSYWAQRRMKEIINFHWVVDGKGAAETTKSEKWWQTMKTGLLQSKLAREPMIGLDWLDYTEFDAKFRTTMPDYLKESILPHEEGFSLNLLLDESFKFSSTNDYGLELADIITNATRRALKGNLAEQGWRHIPKLMIHRKGQYLKIRNLSNSTKPGRVPYARLVTRDFASGGRDMLTKESLG